jgi:aldehyde:ferredoxin oxidoreductase
LKSAGWDAIFITGVASSPKYLLITGEGLQLKDAINLWGKDTYDTEDILRGELGDLKLRIACIGPASEKLSLISGIVNDKGRIAARSGVGAVMGSKRLKAVAVRGRGKVAVFDKDRLLELRKTFLNNLREPQAQGAMKRLVNYGTCGSMEALLIGGATPIKNWLLAGEQAFPTWEKIADANNIIQYQIRKYGCANCPFACSGIMSVPKGPFPVIETHKVEYETIAAFGPMCMNDDLLSIIKLNDVCNRSGLDTISAGTVLAFAMECFEKGIISKKDTDGIELRWGNGTSMLAMLGKIIRREGFGDILADGVKVAAQKIGRSAGEYAMHVGGQEPGLHNALFLPGRGTGFVCDPTPGRHTTGGAIARIDTGSPVIAPYAKLQFKNFERYEYKSKGAASATASSYYHLGSCAGVCLFPLVLFGNYPLVEFLNAATGWDMDIDEALEIGVRIQTLRQSFNIREGIKPSEIRLPPRMAGIPPKSEGPLKGITVDIDTLASEYNKAMGWDSTGVPDEATLERLGLRDLVTAIN